VSANWQYGYAITAEAYGTTTTSAGPYAYTALDFPVAASSVTIKVAGATVATDNGSGQLTGATIASGSITYTTGAMTITFTGAQTNGQAITVNYTAATINTAPSANDICVWNILQVMIQAGWVIQSSGGGTGGTFSASSSTPHVTTRSTGAGGIQNNNNWTTVKAPARSSYIQFQRGTATGMWNVAVSNVGFVGTANGAVSATVAPTASDQWNILNASSGTSITYNDWFNANTAGTFHHGCYADSNAPYGVIAWAWPKNSASASTTFHAFSIDSLAASSYPSGDLDPYVYVCGNNTSYAWNGTNGTSNQAVASVNGVLTNYVTWIGPPGSPQNLGWVASPYTGYDDLFPVYYYFANGSTGGPTRKGQSYYLNFETAANRPTPTLIQQSTTNDTVIIGAFALPWNGGSITIG
jgi:hypothetical protein